MGTWNYRICKSADESGDLFALHEVYYGDDGGVSWTDDPVGFVGESRDEVIHALEVALRDAKKRRVLDLEEEQER